MAQGIKARLAGRLLMIRAVIFDMDGVLVDSEKLGLEASKIAFLKHGAKVKDADVLPYIGAGTRAYVSGLARKYKIDEEVDTLIGERFAAYEKLVKKKGLPARKGALGLLKSAKKSGLKTALATSSSFPKIKMNLKAAKIPISLFDAVVSGTRVKRFKPAPDIFLAAGRRLRVRPSDCVVIEDGEKGILAAKRAGMKAIGVVWTFSAARLKKAGADAVCKDSGLIKESKKMLSF